MTSTPEVSAARLLEERGVTLISLDLDDTLLDSDALAEMRLHAAAEEARRRLPGSTSRIDLALREGLAANPVTVGRLGAFFATLELDSQSAEGVAVRAEYNRVLIDDLDWIEGAREVVLRLRERFTLAVVTNGPTEIQWPKLRKFDIGSLIDHIVVSGDLGLHKPDPGIFEHLLARAGVDASKAAHVGDSVHSDVAGARAAGMTSIWLPPRKREPDEVGEHVPDAVIERLEELLGE
ncbi:MAG: HAD family hydrolase [Dehalococcoidia bacterium]|nr:HAD family hydrolase [Dehalococcoidia bacterium]